MNAYHSFLIAVDTMAVKLGCSIGRTHTLLNSAVGLLVHVFRWLFADSPLLGGRDISGWECDNSASK